MTPILPWIAHLYTATGAVIALLATGMTFAHDFRAVFIYFVAATFVDATDGVLARALRVKERLPHFDGARLDDIVDYLTYVFVPALVVWQAELVPVGVSDLRGDGAVERLRLRPGRRQGRRPTDHFFTGFPSYWNIVVVYLYVLQLPQRDQRDRARGARGAGVRADSLRLSVANGGAEGADAGAGYDVGCRSSPG